MKKFSEHITSKTIRRIIYTLCAIIVICIIFEIGIFFGSRRAPRFEFRGRHNGPTQMMNQGQMHTNGGIDFPHQMVPLGAPGLIGTVTDISPTMITIQSNDGDTIHINTSSTTAIRSGYSHTFSTTSVNNPQSLITKGDVIITIGKPSDTDDTIDARFIRILQQYQNQSPTSTQKQ